MVCARRQENLCCKLGVTRRHENKVKLHRRLLNHLLQIICVQILRQTSIVLHDDGVAFLEDLLNIFIRHHSKALVVLVVLFYLASSQSMS